MLSYPLTQELFLRNKNCQRKVEIAVSCQLVEFAVNGKLE